MKKSGFILLVLLNINLVFGQTSGSKSLLYVQTARTLDVGQFEIRSDLNFYTKLAKGSNPVNYYLVNSGLVFTYGISKNFDLTVAPGIYQDNNRTTEFNLPDDIRVFFKGGSFDFAERHMYFAVQAGLRFPLGEEHNYAFTYYASPAIEYGVSSAFSYFVDPYLPDRSFSVHLNVGWWNHNEAGEVLWGSLPGTVNSQELTFGLGFLYPSELFDFQLELNGITFIEQPDVFVLSREDWMYVSPSVRYKVLNWLNINVGVDIRVSPDKEETELQYAQIKRDIGLPNYAAWKAHFGFDIKLLDLGSGSTSAGQVERDQFNKRVEFFQQIIEDREQSENIKQELDQLKEERESAEEELEELKQILEEEG